MSTIPYPSDFQINYHAERRRRALTFLDPGDVIALVEDTLAQEPEAARHPLFPVVNWLLDRQVAVHGGDFWDTWKRRCQAAIDQLVDEAMSRGED